MRERHDAEATARARRVEALVLDVDGVLTDGRLYYTAKGETLKSFHSRDGFAIKLAQSCGLAVAVLSGRGGSVLRRRLHELGIPAELVVEASRHKLEDLQRLCRTLHLAPEQVAYMGDDLPDLAVLRRVGLASAPADAAPEVKRYCHLVTNAAGGQGAVRELVFFVLRAKGLWDQVWSQWEGSEA